MVTGQLWCRVGNLYRSRESRAIGEIGKKLRDKTAADADRFFAELFGPDAFEAYAHGRKDGHMENGQESVGDTLGA